MKLLLYPSQVQGLSDLGYWLVAIVFIYFLIPKKEDVKKAI